MILINQHNYEEFFMLYADGELSATDKQAVEQFVQANPGFADELEMFSQMKLTDEPIVFEDKNSLFRDASHEIGLFNYEEYFLLYIDNELDVATKQQVETFVLQHPNLQATFTGLKQTLLPIETIAFATKELLYKKESAVKPIFYLSFQRGAVAAAVIGLAVLAWTLFPTNLTNQTIANLPTATNQSHPANANNPVTSVKTNLATNNTVNRLAEVNKKISRNALIMQQTVVTPTKNAELAQSAATEVLAANTTVPPKRESIISNPIVRNEQLIVTNQLPLTSNNPTESTSVKITKAVANTTPDNLAQSIVYKELDTDDANKSLYLGSIEINKDKLRGFFRKANNLFRGKARLDDEKTESSIPTTRTLK